MQGLRAGWPHTATVQPQGCLSYRTEPLGCYCHLGYNPRTLAQQPCQGERGNLIRGPDTTLSPQVLLVDIWPPVGQGQHVPTCFWGTVLLPAAR